MSKGITADAAGRVAEYIRQRDKAMEGGNVGDVITTVYSDTAAEPAHLDVNDLRVLVHAYRPATQHTPLAGELRAAAARLHSYIGHSPRHWGFIEQQPYTGPMLVSDTGGEEVEVVGSVDGLTDQEMDLIGLLSPVVAANLSALLDTLADQIDTAPLSGVRWMAEASALALALNRMHDWATHPRGIRMQEPNDD
jgi:hypothetical protein